MVDDSAVMRKIVINALNDAGLEKEEIDTDSHRKREALSRFRSLLGKFQEQVNLEPDQIIKLLEDGVQWEIYTRRKSLYSILALNTHNSLPGG